MIECKNKDPDVLVYHPRIFILHETLLFLKRNYTNFNVYALFDSKYNVSCSVSCLAKHWLLSLMKV